ncbi:ABC transporter substrate-binding protein [Paenibacillus senegalensis]|uniref:ABC transporter substrate-binding protein n=1 Tax=Paenibacillus senegalensis TaxID=1465766 RepID=UPI000289281B|nr:ABC transporter substrate-binding protein [Paenibacillus senegalensis]
MKRSIPDSIPFIPLVLSLLLILLFAASCASAEGPAAPDSSLDSISPSPAANSPEMQKEDEEETGQPFPRTVKLYEQEVLIEEKPQSIAALSLDVSEIVLSLVEPERIAAVSRSTENDYLSHHSEQAREVKTKVVGAKIDPEQVLSFDTDLVLITLTHGAEQDATEMLQSAGIPLASFERWHTIELLKQNIGLIGQLVGEENKAQSLIEQIDEEISNVQAAVETFKEKPSVLVISQVSSNSGPYVLGPTSIAYDIVKHAGGTPGSDLLNLDRTASVSIEHLIEADPDYIILAEWGTASDEFSELIASPGFQTLRAVATDQVKTMKARDLMISNPYAVLHGMKEISEWLHPDKFQ